MDYLDINKQTRRRITLLIGYVAVAVAVFTATYILLQQAYGFGLNSQGQVIQNGMVFVSSQPNGASIYMNGIKRGATNTRLSLPEDIYQMKISEPGYQDWTRSVNLLGGSIMHFDYPLLIPSKLTTTSIGSVAQAPSLSSQSPDKRWLLVGSGDPQTPDEFKVYDLKNIKNDPITLTIPKDTVGTGATSDSWTQATWADDNKHVLLTHVYDGKTEYLLLDRTAVNAGDTVAVNLTTTLSLPDGVVLTFDNLKSNRYYLFDPSTDTLQSEAETDPANSVAPVTVLQHALAYKTYSDDTVLYVTADGAKKDQVLLKIQQGSKTYTIHSLPTSKSYLLDLTGYSGSLYVVASSVDENKVYIYRDPIGQLNSQPGHAPVPSQVLHVVTPTYVGFSQNAQFIVAENGTQFGVYDIENKVGYNYIAKYSLDTPQVHATWMDGDRLMYVSDGKLVEMDYDDTNVHQMQAALPSFVPAFNSSYKFAYSFAPSSAGVDLTQTSLTATQ